MEKDLQERLIEISGKNRSLYLKSFTKKNGFDIGKILYYNQELAMQFLEQIWSGKSTVFNLIGKETKNEILKANKVDEKFFRTEFENEKEKQKFVNMPL